MMLGAIAGAQRQVLLSMYWIGHDATGLRLIEALAQAAARAVRVCVLFDGFGSFGAAPQLRELAGRGVEVVEFHPMAPWRRRFRLDRVGRRSHTKLLVVDDHTAFVGGINFADAACVGTPPWRDDALRVTGPVAVELARRFSRPWQRATGSPITMVPWTGEASIAVDVLEQWPLLRNDVTRAYHLELARAHARAWIANAYFLPTRSLLRRLLRAARRGVDVRVMVPLRSDVRFVQYATRFLFDRLLRGGVRIFEFTDAMLHAKTAVVDTRWLTTGSYNLDRRSARTNHELNLGVQSHELAADMEACFLADQQRCREVKLTEFRLRPLQERVIEWLCFLCRGWL